MRLDILALIVSILGINAFWFEGVRTMFKKVGGHLLSPWTLRAKIKNLTEIVSSYEAKVAELEARLAEIETVRKLHIAPVDHFEHCEITPGRSVFRVRGDTGEHYFCPNCVGKNGGRPLLQRSPIPGFTKALTKWICPKCRFQY